MNKMIRIQFRGLGLLGLVLVMGNLFCCTALADQWVKISAIECMETDSMNVLTVTWRDPAGSSDGVWAWSNSGGTLSSKTENSAEFTADEEGIYNITYTKTYNAGHDTITLTDEVNIYVDQTVPPQYWREEVLSQGRKVSITGMPMPDVAQHQEGESDYKPEETYVDALSLDLQHSVTDVYVPVGSDHFSLEVRRNLDQEVWTTNSVPLASRLDMPFGPCWSSALCSSLKISSAWNGSLRTYVAQDHNGQRYILKGVKWWSLDLEKQIPYLWAEPQGTQSALAMDGVDLSVASLTNAAAVWGNSTAIVLSLPNGTKCYYSAEFNAMGESTTNKGDFDTITDYYFRMEKVVDRAGNTLTYNYTNSSDMIPSSIEASTGQTINITPSADGKRVERVEDPRGNFIDYNYTNLTYNGYENTMLVSVERSDGGTTHYTYQHNTEEDDRETLPEYKTLDYEHLTIEHIVDANLNTNSFAYTVPERFDFKPGAASNRVDQIGNNRILSSLTRPDGSSVSFSEASGALGLVPDAFNPLTLNTVRTNMVVDVNSNQWIYVFSDPHVTYPIDSGGIVRMFQYKNMTINGPGEATETYRYDVLGVTLPNRLEPIAIAAQSNFSGQASTFGYATTNSGCYKPSVQYDAMDNAVHYTYTTNFGHQVESKTDALGRFTLYQFDDIGNRTNALQCDIFYEAPYSWTNVLGETRMEYTNTNLPNFMTKKTVKALSSGVYNDPTWVSNMVVKYIPHAYGKVGQEIVDPDGLALTTTYDYDENNNLTYVKDPKGNVTTNGYDNLNRLVKIAFFEGEATLKCTKQFWYDQRSNKRWEKDENDHYTYFEYDQFNHLVKMVRIMDESFSGPASGSASYSAGANDIISSSEYNSDGTLHASTDPRGLRTEYGYDDLRRLRSTTVDPGTPPQHLNYETFYEYSTNGNYCGGITLPPYQFTPTSVTDPRGFETKTVYDVLNRPVETWAEVTNGVLSKMSTMGYDQVGNLRFSTNWVDGTVNQVIETIYDGLNRPIQTIMAKGTADQAEVGIRYTSTGLEWQSTNELDRVSTTEYDAAGRPVKTISPPIYIEGIGWTNAVTATQYDANSNARFVTDANGNTTEQVYDYRNRPVRTIAPSVADWGNGGGAASPVVVTTYDQVGNATSITDARENTTTNFYDAANRLVETWAPEVAVYTQGSKRPKTYNYYDQSGNITSTVDANNKTVQMFYDIAGRLTNTVDAVANTITFEYDANGNQTALIDGESSRTEFLYDGLNRKTRTLYKGDGSGTTYEDAVYDRIGNRIRRIDCNGVETQYDYDLRNRLRLVTYPGSRTREYDYDHAGNLLSVDESGGTPSDVSYTYDALNRVKTETSVGVTHTYYYDLNGNRTSAEYGITGRQVEWEYDALNRIVQVRDLTSAYASTNNVSSGANLQNAIDTAAAGSLILVGDGSYGPVELSNDITLQSVNGPGSTTISASGGRAASLSGGAQLIGFTLTGGTLGGTNCGAGAFVNTGCLISDCVITNNQTASSTNVVTSPGGKGGGLYLRGTALRCTIEGNTAWKGAGAFLEHGAGMADCTVRSNTAGDVNGYGGGLYLQDGASAFNCLMENNAATDGGGLFFEQGGFARDISSLSNAVESIGGAGAFLWAGGTLRNGVIVGNVATNEYARGGAGIMFYDAGGLVEDSIIAENTSVANGGIDYRYSGENDPGKLGTLNNSIIWGNSPGQASVWNGTGNQFVDPDTVSGAPTGANVENYAYADAQARTTGYFYDLNGNLVKRIYPSRVEETRTFDAMNRLLTLRTQTLGHDWFDVAYQYDAVGSLRHRDHTRSSSLAGKAASGVCIWQYDDRYRLTFERVIVTGPGGSDYQALYAWDHADNRLTKRVTKDYVLQENITYTNNALNQIDGWHDAVTGKDVSYAYDANGSRTNMTVSIGATTSETAYDYDEDNRLLQVFADSITNTFAYDYRSRRYYRATSTETNVCVFDGGLSVQEYDASSTLAPESSNLQVEYLRGPDLGGGVGGMVYSIRKDEYGNGAITCSHSNHRGDVIARSDDSGSLTWFALYEAYGTRPYVWPNEEANPDRQKANTKDEEAEIGLLNEGMRFRDLETGTFLTRDPIGYADGPNIYCYVHCNPITRFDPLGLKTIADYQQDLANAQAKRDAALEQLDKDLKPGTKSYNQKRLNIRRGYGWAVKEAENGINKICQTASSMSALAGIEVDPTLLDDEWSHYKAYRRSDWYMNFTGSKQFAKNWTDGKRWEATGDLITLECENLIAYMLGAKFGEMLTAGAGLSDDILRSSLDDILRPNGDMIGYVHRGAKPNIRTVSPKEFSQLKRRLLKGAKKAESYAEGKGTWYKLPEGGRVGVRSSSESGVTLDIDIQGFPEGLKVHQK